MNIAPEEVFLLLTGLIALVGGLTSFLKNRRLKALTEVILAFSDETACYIKFKQQGSLNTDELKYLGLQSVRFFEKVEALGLELGRS